MVANQEKFEYNAWLQPRAAMTVPDSRLTGSDEAAFAMKECRLGLKKLFGRDICRDDAEFEVKFTLDSSMGAESYKLVGASTSLAISSADASGFLYGVYALLARIRIGGDLTVINEASSPSVMRRVLNHWDNIDGSVERGYSGKSIFFKNNTLCYDPDRITDYAELLASIGINQVCCNNVNVTADSAKLITEELLPELAKLADIFRLFGIRLIIAVDFGSPVLLGKLPSADPLDERVAQWWSEAADLVYSYVPDLAGFLVKADSEFRDGPAALGRTQADGANVIARALSRYQGTVYWRCFVYNCMQDWRDEKTDRPKAAYDHFYPLDGAFDSNVVLQIKNGPTDFQVREPNSPLLGAMKKTRQGIEFQVTQEYTGQQIDLYALAVQWEEVFDHPISESRITRDLMGREIDTIAAVSNVGDDTNWTGHLLAQANLFAFGRMAWNPTLSAKEVLEEWIRLTFGYDKRLIESLLNMMLISRSVYEKYNAPLGIGWMVNISHHYGPSVDGYEYMKWGTYHRADNYAIGVDRTSKGTGFTAQYDQWVDDMYSNIETCPEELLLFFHRIPYKYKLKSGKTLIQHIYDTHFEGVEDVEMLFKTWYSLKELIPSDAYDSVARRIKLQIENAKEWRDVINAYFYRKTGIADNMGRKIYHTHILTGDDTE